MNTLRNSILFSLVFLFSIDAFAGDPEVNDDIITVEANVSTFLDLLVNDYDTEDYNLSPCNITILSQPSNGTVVLKGNNLCMVEFTGNNTYSTSTFAYQVCDRDGDCSSATVELTTKCQVAEIIAPKTVLCPNERFTFRAFENKQPNLTYDWNFGAGAVPAVGTGLGPHVIDYGGVAGPKTVSLTVSGGACGSETVSLDVVVRDAVVADAGGTYDAVEGMDVIKLSGCPDSVGLGSNVQNEVMYYWQDDLYFTDFSSRFESNPRIDPGSANFENIYNLIVVDNFCTTVDSVLVRSDTTDLSVVLKIIPTNFTGTSSIGIAVKVRELKCVDSDGSLIMVRIPSDPKLSFNWDPNLNFVAFTDVENVDWNYLGNNGIVHTFSTSKTLKGSEFTAFGLQAVYDPQNTQGQTTITATVIPKSGGETNFTNNQDSEKLIYFY